MTVEDLISELLEFPLRYEVTGIEGFKRNEAEGTIKVLSESQATVYTEPGIRPHGAKANVEEIRKSLTKLRRVQASAHPISGQVSEGMRGTLRHTVR